VSSLSGLEGCCRFFMMALDSVPLMQKGPRKFGQYDKG